MPDETHKTLDETFKSPAMKTAQKLRDRALLLAVLAGAAILAAPAAQAFTVDDKSNANSDGSAKYVDPDARFSGAANGQTVIRNGNSTFRFGPAQQRSFDDRSAVDRMFNPNGRPNDGR